MANIQSCLTSTKYIIIIILEHLFRNYVLKCLETTRTLLLIWLNWVLFYSKWYHQLMKPTEITSLLKVMAHFIRLPVFTSRIGKSNKTEHDMKTIL